MTYFALINYIIALKRIEIGRNSTK